MSCTRALTSGTIPSRCARNSSLSTCRAAPEWEGEWRDGCDSSNEQRAADQRHELRRARQELAGVQRRQHSNSNPKWQASAGSALDHTAPHKFRRHCNSQSSRGPQPQHGSAPWCLPQTRPALPQWWAPAAGHPIHQSVACTSGYAAHGDMLSSTRPGGMPPAGAPAHPGPAASSRTTHQPGALRTSTRMMRRSALAMLTSVFFSTNSQ